MNGRWEKILSQAHIYEYSACDQDVTAVICRENKRYLRYFKIIFKSDMYLQIWCLKNLDICQKSWHLDKNLMSKKEVLWGQGLWNDLEYFSLPARSPTISAPRNGED